MRKSHQDGQVTKSSGFVVGTKVKLVPKDSTLPTVYNFILDINSSTGKITLRNTIPAYLAEGDYLVVAEENNA